MAQVLDSISFCIKVQRIAAAGCGTITAVKAEERRKNAARDGDGIVIGRSVFTVSAGKCALLTSSDGAALDIDRIPGGSPPLSCIRRKDWHWLCPHRR